MKYSIITESRLDNIINDEYRQILTEGFFDDLAEAESLEEAKQIIKKYIRRGVSVALIISALIGGLHINRQRAIELAQKAMQEMEMTKENLRKELITAVDEYIRHRAPNTPINAEVLVDAAIRNNYDIPLLMSQAQNESMYGTTGVGAKNGSIFNVGNYDNGQQIYNYASDPNQSIEPYIKLMQNHYLANKSINQLLSKDGQYDENRKKWIDKGSFINADGNRYASFPKYESAVKSQRNHIIQQTNIKSIEDKLKNLK